MSTLKSMKERLKAAEFRWLNEKLYTHKGQEAFEEFQEDPTLFDKYHEGFRKQVKKWPVNPLDLIINKLEQRPKSTIADMGCGDAELAVSLGKKHIVHSFDLVSKDPAVVTACDIAHVPLEDASVDVVVFSLALMGTNFDEFLREGTRILRTGGTLLIAEVESRITSVPDFTNEVCELGFKLVEKNTSRKMFFLFEFSKSKVKFKAKAREKRKKIQDGDQKSNKALKPCLYKRR